MGELVLIFLNASLFLTMFSHLQWHKGIRLYCGKHIVKLPL